MKIAAAALLFAVAGVAQSPFAAQEERTSTRLAWLTHVARPVALRIDYGAARWRPEYEAEVARKRARTFRLGNGGWATLHAGAQLTMGDRRLPPGIWYLALQRAADGGWSLAVFESAKVLRHGILPGQVHDLEPAVRLPMTLRSAPAEADGRAAADGVMQQTLQLRLTPRPGAIPLEAEPLGTAVLSIRWGRHELQGTLIADLEVVEPQQAGDRPEFRALDAARAVATASGLRYEVLRDGVGSPPGLDDKVRVHYVGWLADGTQIDSSLDRGAAAVFAPQHVIAGWTEGLQLMNPGAAFLFEVPAELGYGQRGAGDRIPPDATLYFYIELLATLPE